MDNHEFAQIMNEIALLKQIKGENRYKVRAFENAALVIEALGEPVADVIDRGELTEIEGIGESIARDLRQIAETGTCSIYERLLQELGPGLLQLTRIQGLGPKRIKQLHDELGVASTDELRQLAEAGRVEELAGFGTKTVEKILREIERLEASAGRTPLPTALRYARRVQAVLEQSPGLQRCAVAGSIRRGRETVGDIDLLCTVAPGADSGPIMDALVGMPEVEEVLVRGPTKISVRLRRGPQVDVRVVADDCFGAALHYFTGSKAHHIKLRTRAKRQGLTINEYGVFSERAIGHDTPIAYATEEDVYRALDLDFIPPELRQGHDEIELAARGELPRLVEASQIRGDLHMHTTETDGEATIERMARAAHHMGYGFVAITDHSQAVAVANGMTPARFRRHAERIREVDRALREELDFRVLVGIEVDILKGGDLDMEDELLAEADWVVGSIHSHFQLDEGPMTDRLVRACATGLLSCLGHPTGRILGGREGYRYDMEVVLEAARDHGVAVEINGSPGRLDFNSEMARYSHQRGLKIVLGSDAHSTRGLRSLVFAIQQARRAGLKADDVLNTYAPDDLLAAVRPALH